MILRILQIVIVLFWLGTTAALIRRTYFADFSRFPSVDPSEVAEKFFAHTSSSDLILLQDGELLGRLFLSPRTQVRSRNLQQKAFAEGSREIAFHCRIAPEEVATQLPEEVMLTERMEANGSIILDSDLKWSSVRVRVQLPEMRVQGRAVLQQDPLTYQVEYADQLLLDSRRPELLTERLEEVRGMVDQHPALANLDLSMLESLQGGQAMELIHQSLVGQLQPRVDARKGSFRMLAHRYNGYIVRLDWVEGENGLTLFLGENGELLRIEGVPGFEILGELFVPQELLVDPED